MTQTEFTLEASLTPAAHEREALLDAIKRSHRRFTKTDIAQIEALARAEAGSDLTPETLNQALRRKLKAVSPAITEADILRDAFAVRLDRSAALVPLTEAYFYRFTHGYLSSAASRIALWENYRRCYPHDYVFLIRTPDGWRHAYTSPLPVTLKLLQNEQP